MTPKAFEMRYGKYVIASIRPDSLLLKNTSKQLRELGSISVPTEDLATAKRLSDRLGRAYADFIEAMEEAIAVQQRAESMGPRPVPRTNYSKVTALPASSTLRPPFNTKALEALIDPSDLLFGPGDDDY